MNDWVTFGVAGLGLIGTLAGTSLGAWWAERSQINLFDEGEKREVLRKKAAHVMNALSGVQDMCDALEYGIVNMQQRTKIKRLTHQQIRHGLTLILKELTLARVYNTNIADASIIDHMLYEVDCWDARVMPTENDLEFWLMSAGSSGKTKRNYRYPQYKDALNNMVRADLLGEPRKILDWDRTGKITE